MIRSYPALLKDMSDISIEIHTLISVQLTKVKELVC